MKIVGIHLEPGAVGWHRTWNWTTALERLGHKVWHKPHAGTQFNVMGGEMDRIVRDADVVIAGRMAHGQLFAGLLAGRDLYGYKLVVDTDDDADSVPEYNFSQPDYHAGKDVVRLVRAEFKYADLVTASTPVLAERISKYCKRYPVVVQNVVDPRLHARVVERQKEARHRGDQRIYFGSGGNHYGDIMTVKDAILRVFRERPKVKLVFSQFIPGWAADLPPFRVFVLRSAKFEEYPQVLKWICADVALAPLVDNDFNRCKSHVKYLDYAMAGVPGIYQDLPPYESVENGITGLKANTSQEWYESICALLDDSGLAGSIVTAAKDDVLSRWTIDGHIRRYETLLQELIVRKAPEFTLLSEGVPVEAPCLMQPL